MVVGRAKNKIVARGLGRALRGAAAGLERGRAHLTDAARVARFVDGALRFEPREDDVYVATYPRSGTTWMQFILYLLRSERAVDFEHISLVSPWYERTLAHGTRRIEDFAAMPSTRVFKTHLPPQWLPETGRVIYIERDGRDVAVSYFHLYRTHLGFEGTFHDFFERFMAGRVQYGSWFKHVKAWRNEAKSPRVLSLRYESMLADPRASIESVADFLGWPVAPSAWPDILHKASRGFMKAHEARFDPITETLIDQGLSPGNFIRDAKRGAGEAALNDAEQSAFTRRAEGDDRFQRVELDLPAFLH